MESETNYPQLTDRRYMSGFDITMTYRLDSDVPALYFDRQLVNALSQAPVSKTEEAHAVYLVSSRFNRSCRYEYVRELMRHIDIHSYGKSLNNRKLAFDVGRQTKLDNIARYRFRTIM